MTPSTNDLAAVLTGALSAHLSGGSVTVTDAKPIGTGQMSSSVRVTVATDPPGLLPGTLVVKRPSADPASRAASRATRTYEIETAFYRDLRPRLAVNAPGCWHVSYDSEHDDFLLVLDDMSPGVQGDQIAGATPEQVASAVDELAHLHGPLWGNDSLADLPWLNRASPEQRAGTRSLLSSCWPRFLDRYGDHLDAATRRIGSGFVADSGSYFEMPTGPLTVVHGDYRLDNLLFDPRGGRTAVVDFQTVVLGAGASDLAYLVGGSLPTESRRAVDTAMVARWVAGLALHGAAAGDAWGQYRRGAWAGFVMSVVASVLVQRSERGDEMFVTMANRHASHADDLESLAAVRG